MQRIFCGDARLLRQERMAPNCWKVTLHVPSTEPVRAGQFCHVQVAPGPDPLLRRPFSYWDVRPVAGGQEVDLLYTVVGRGTARLAERRPGESVGFLGPLGVGFTPDPASSSWIFVAGGVGIVPFYLFSKQTREAGLSPRLVLLFGGRNASMLYGIDEFPALGAECVAATEDGSRGARGLVTKILEERLDAAGEAGARLYTCGPERMMEAVVRIARARRLPCEVSMEKHMGCALGACGACVTKVKDGEGWRHSRICMEGPTYDEKVLVLE
jgi:dihydroorotate dehydrogenase electron transfer subunit